MSGVGELVERKVAEHNSVKRSGAEPIESEERDVVSVALAVG